MAQSKKSTTNQGASDAKKKSPVTAKPSEPTPSGRITAEEPKSIAEPGFTVQNETSQRLVVSVQPGAGKTSTIDLPPRGKVRIAGEVNRWVRSSLAIYGGQLSLVE
jgi:hypothetical protein